MISKSFSVYQAKFDIHKPDGVIPYKNVTMIDWLTDWLADWLIDFNTSLEAVILESVYNGPNI